MVSSARSPSIALLPFLGEGSPTKTDYRKKGYPDSDLSTGPPSVFFCGRCLPSFLLALMFGVLATAERLFSRSDWTVAHVMPSADSLTEEHIGPLNPWESISPQENLSSRMLELTHLGVHHLAGSIRRILSPIWFPVKEGHSQLSTSNVGNSRATIFRKPSNTQGNSLFLKRTMVEKNGKSTSRAMPRRADPCTPCSTLTLRWFQRGQSGYDFLFCPRQFHFWGWDISGGHLKLTQFGGTLFILSSSGALFFHVCWLQVGSKRNQQQTTIVGSPSFDTYPEQRGCALPTLNPFHARD